MNDRGHARSRSICGRSWSPIWSNTRHSRTAARNPAVVASPGHTQIQVCRDLVSQNFQWLASPMSSEPRSDLVVFRAQFATDEWRRLQKKPDFRRAIQHGEIDTAGQSATIGRIEAAVRQAKVSELAERAPCCCVDHDRMSHFVATKPVARICGKMNHIQWLSFDSPRISSIAVANTPSCASTNFRSSFMGSPLPRRKRTEQHVLDRSLISRTKGLECLAPPTASRASVNARSMESVTFSISARFGSSAPRRKAPRMEQDQRPLVPSL